MTSLKRKLAVLLVVCMVVMIIAPAYAGFESNPKIKNTEAGLASPSNSEYELASPSVAKFVLAQTAPSSRIDTIFERMTPKERIAQMLVMQAPTLDGDLKDLYAQYKFGGVISFADNMKDTSTTFNLSKQLQAAVISNNGVPMIIAANQEGGSVQCIAKGTPMPGNMAIAATGDTSNACTAGQIIGEELDVLGYNCVFAPDIDIISNPENLSMAVKSFGDTADIVTDYSTAFLEGLETANIIGCVKYFAGQGDAIIDSITGCQRVDKSWKELLDHELVPFRSAIAQNADMIMVSHIIYPQVDGGKITATKGKHAGKEVGIPATLSKIMLTDKLRDELGYEGVICTDCMSTGGMSSLLSTNESVARAINAGADLICMPLADDAISTPENFSKNVDTLISYIKANVSPNRIEESVKRILTLKENRGILDYDESKHSEKDALETVGNEEFRQTERDMAACGVTLVKNADNALPLKIGPDAKVLMLVQDYNDGRNEHYAAQFIMGWNRAAEAGLIPVNANVDVVMFDESDWNSNDKLNAIDNADYIFTDSIFRDKKSMEYETWRTAAPKKYTDYAKEKGKKSFVISIDAPYDVQLYPNADGILAIYNPTGSRENWKDVLENGKTASKYAMGANLTAAVEVALGVYGACGTLPVNIYEFDTDSNSYDFSKIVYERGFGIQYDPITSMDKVNVILEFSQAEYTGKEIRPKVIVSVTTRDDKIKYLTEGKDYSVTYSNNINPGTATVVIGGMGNYIGSKSENFLIIEKKNDHKSRESRSIEKMDTGTWNNPVSGGTWNYNSATGKWTYTTSGRFVNTWGYIVNPYAKAGQNTADWFYFDAYGNMLTGWQFIQGKWYYLNPTKDGTLGACQIGGVTPDGWTVDESGAWIESISRK